MTSDIRATESVCDLSSHGIWAYLNFNRCRIANMSNGIYYFYAANLNIKHSLVVSLRGGNCPL